MVKKRVKNNPFTTVIGLLLIASGFASLWWSKGFDMYNSSMILIGAGLVVAKDPSWLIKAVNHIKP